MVGGFPRPGVAHLHCSHQRSTINHSGPQVAANGREDEAIMNLARPCVAPVNGFLVLASRC